MTLRENWRVIVLTILLVASGLTLFVPGMTVGSSVQPDPTTLQYGIQLDGGSRIRAPIVGMTAEGVDVSPENANQLEATVAERLGVDPIDVRVAAGSGGSSGTVEVFTSNVTQDELRQVLESEGHGPSRVRDGVTQATRDDMVEVIRNKISASGLSGGTVRQVATGDSYRIEVVAPNRDLDELERLLSDRGVVRVYAYHPDENGTFVRDQVLAQSDFQSVGNAQDFQTLGPGVQVTVRQGTPADRFAEDMVQYDFGQGSRCPTSLREAARNDENPSEGDIPGGGGLPNRCLVSTLDGEVFFVSGVEPDLGRSFANGDFAKDPTFVMTTGSLQEARDVEISLKAGRLPAPLALGSDDASKFELEPGLANRFKLNSLITGLIAVLAVSLTVYIRYDDVRVAAPMVVTALSEVALLLGFAAAVQYPLDLSVIAGFIAVIGTGVDDLIIIADEVMSEGEVDSSRIFQNRFRRAFWVIGAAAATTIIAMSPLAVLSLGDLRGFAIVTILGVVIGVVITRPAYGDILRQLVTKR